MNVKAFMKPFLLLYSLLSNFLQLQLEENLLPFKDKKGYTLQNYLYRYSVHKTLNFIMYSNKNYTAHMRVTHYNRQQ